MSGYAKLASSALSFTKKYWKELLIFFCVFALFAKRYSERLVDLELEHADDKEALLEEYAKRKKAYVIAFGENGEGLKKDIEDYLGLEYVKP